MFGRGKPTSRATLIQTPHLPRVTRVRGVAWSILGGSGPLDSGSNPDGPTRERGRVEASDSQTGFPSVGSVSAAPRFRPKDGKRRNPAGVLSFAYASLRLSTAMC